MLVWVVLFKVLVVSLYVFCSKPANSQIPNNNAGDHTCTGHVALGTHVNFYACSEVDHNGVQHQTGLLLHVGGMILHVV